MCACVCVCVCKITDGISTIVGCLMPNPFLYI